MALILQMLLMGECASLIGSFSSNVAVIVHDLMLCGRARIVDAHDGRQRLRLLRLRRVLLHEPRAQARGEPDEVAGTTTDHRRLRLPG